MKWFASVLVGLVMVGCASPSTRVVVAAGTTLVDSGFLDALVEQYEQEHPGVELSVVGESTARVLGLGEAGAADLLIAHAPELEAAFVAAGLAESRVPVLDSGFVLVAPPDVARALGGLDTVEAMTRIGTREVPALFVSRGDGSGTHLKELGLWELAGVDPTGADWYIEAGLGMGPTLQVADQRNAVTVSELGAFLASANLVDLEVVDDGGSGLANPYSAIVVAGSDVAEEATAFVEWILANPQLVEDLNQELFGIPVYRPAAP